MGAVDARINGVEIKKPLVPGIRAACKFSAFKVLQLYRRYSPGRGKPL